MSIELLPCPMCGADPIIEDMAGWEIWCECGIGLCLDKPDKGPLIEHWNRRAPMAADDSSFLAWVKAHRPSWIRMWIAGGKP